MLKVRYKVTGLMHSSIDFIKIMCYNYIKFSGGHKEPFEP